MTDVGSTKKEIMDFAATFKDKITFIGSHPLAGSEKTGVEHSCDDLFYGSMCVLTPSSETHEKDRKRLIELWEAMGAGVIIVDPAAHDKNLAFSSHLPHVVAYALAGILKEKFDKNSPMLYLIFCKVWINNAVDYCEYLVENSRMR